MTDDRTRGRGGAVKQLLILPREASTAVLRECGYEVKTMTNADLLERLDDQGLYSKAERIQMIKDAAAEIRRLRAGHGAGREAEAMTERPSTIVISDWLANCQVGQWTPFEAATALKDVLAKEGYAIVRARAAWDKGEHEGCGVDSQRTFNAAALERTAGRETDHPDCRTDRERELYDALMGLASHAAARHRDFSQWTQGGVTLEPIVRKALRLDAAPSPDDQPAGCESAARSARIAIDKV